MVVTEVGRAGDGGAGKGAGMVEGRGVAMAVALAVGVAVSVALALVVAVGGGSDGGVCDFCCSVCRIVHIKWVARINIYDYISLLLRIPRLMW